MIQEADTIFETEDDIVNEKQLGEIKQYEAMLRQPVPKMSNYYPDSQGDMNPFLSAICSVRLFFADILAAAYIFWIHTYSLESLAVCLNAAGASCFFLFYLPAYGHYLASKLDFTFLSFAVVFPLTFLVQQSFRRREQVLVLLADFKALLLNLFLAKILWDFPNKRTKEWGGLVDLPDTFFQESRDVAAEMLQEVFNFLSLATALKGRHLVMKTHNRKLLHTKSEISASLDNIGALFRKSFGQVEFMKSQGLSANEASRMNQYHWFLQARIERLRQFKMYRTPQANRSFGRVYMYLLPWFSGPYFAWVASLGGSSSTQANHAFAIALSVFTFLLLFGLINAGRYLEDPFVKIGYDNVDLVSDFNATLKQLNSHIKNREEGVMIHSNKTDEI